MLRLNSSNPSALGIEVVRDDLACPLLSGFYKSSYSLFGTGRKTQEAEAFERTKCLVRYDIGSALEPYCLHSYEHVVLCLV